MNHNLFKAIQEPSVSRNLEEKNFFESVVTKISIP